mgnify:FL=1
MSTRQSRHTVQAAGFVIEEFTLLGEALDAAARHAKDLRMSVDVYSHKATRTFIVATVNTTGTVINHY